MTNKKHLCLTLLCLAFIQAITTGCNDTFDDSSMLTCRLIIQPQFPDDINGESLTDAAVCVRNISTRIEEYYPATDEIFLTPGLYDITYTAHYTLPNGVTSTLRGSIHSVQVTGDNTLLKLKTYSSIDTDDLIISEIFFTGTLQSSGNQYYGDDYIKLYNNTDHVIYADGLTLFESKFTTVNKYDYSPDIMDEAVTVHALYTIPGNGNEHPVQPGEYIMLADNGIDNRILNPNSFDLRHANFEWYDVSTKPSHVDIDSPEVPNLDKWYCYTLSFWTLHNRGFKTYGIARIPIDKETYLKDYLYQYDYTIVVPAGTFPMTGSAYRLPNSWIVDVVNCSVQSEFQWILTSPRLDMGWTHCGTIDHDKSRYFHSVRRKALYLRPDGTPVLQDTNNSTEDFNPMCIPSEIEEQGSAIDVNGTPCTSLTYDGILPKPRK